MIGLIVLISYIDLYFKKGKDRQKKGKEKGRNRQKERLII